MCRINCSGGCQDCAAEEHIEEFVLYAFSNESPWIDWRKAVDEYIVETFKEEWSIKAANEWYTNWKQSLNL